MATSLSVTRDGGKSWQGIDVPGRIMAAELLPDGHGWVLGQEVHGHSFGPGVLYTTSDAGASWTALKLPADAPPGMTTISFADTEHGWFFDGTHLYFTAGSGKTWTQMS